MDLFSTNVAPVTHPSNSAQVPSSVVDPAVGSSSAAGPSSAGPSTSVGGQTHDVGGVPADGTPARSNVPAFGSSAGGLLPQARLSTDSTSEGGGLEAFVSKVRAGSISGLAGLKSMVKDFTDTSDTRPQSGLSRDVTPTTGGGDPTTRYDPYTTTSTGNPEKARADAVPPPGSGSGIGATVSDLTSSAKSGLASLVSELRQPFVDDTLPKAPLGANEGLLLTDPSPRVDPAALASSSTTLRPQPSGESSTRRISTTSTGSGSGIGSTLSSFAASARSGLQSLVAEIKAGAADDVEAAKTGVASLRGQSAVTDAPAAAKNVSKDEPGPVAIISGLFGGAATGASSFVREGGVSVPAAETGTGTGAETRSSIGASMRALAAEMRETAAEDVAAARTGVNSLTGAGTVTDAPVAAKNVTKDEPGPAEIVTGLFGGAASGANTFVQEGGVTSATAGTGSGVDTTTGSGSGLQSIISQIREGIADDYDAAKTGVASLTGQGTVPDAPVAAKSVSKDAPTPAEVVTGLYSGFATGASSLAQDTAKMTSNDTNTTSKSTVGATGTPSTFLDSVKSSLTGGSVLNTGNVPGMTGSVATAPSGASGLVDSTPPVATSTGGVLDGGPSATSSAPPGASTLSRSTNPVDPSGVGRVDDSTSGGLSGGAAAIGAGIASGLAAAGAAASSLIGDESKEKSSPLGSATGARSAAIDTPATATSTTSGLTGGVTGTSGLLGTSEGVLGGPTGARSGLVGSSADPTSDLTSGSTGLLGGATGARSGPVGSGLTSDLIEEPAASTTSTGDGPGVAAVGTTTTYSSRKLGSGDPVPSVADTKSTDPTTFVRPESSGGSGASPYHSATTGSTGGIGSTSLGTIPPTSTGTGVGPTVTTGTATTSTPVSSGVASTGAYLHGTDVRGGSTTTDRSLATEDQTGSGATSTGTALGGRADGNTSIRSTSLVHDIVTGGTTGTGTSSSTGNGTGTGLSGPTAVRVGDPITSPPADTPSAPLGKRDSIASSNSKRGSLDLAKSISSSSGRKWSGTGAPGSHSALFGLTPDGAVHTDTKSDSTPVYAAHSRSSVVAPRPDNPYQDPEGYAAKNFSSHERVDSGIAGADQDPRVIEPGHGKHTLSATGAGGSHPGSGLAGQEPGSGHDSVSAAPSNRM